jgi:ABC-type uncharacterized transport system permease subunit
MRDVLGIVIEIILAIVGAVFFGSLVVALGALAIGCVVAGGCWGVVSRQRRRSAQAEKAD